MEFDCDRLADTLLDLATGRLGSADRCAAESHLAECPSCVERVRRCRGVIAGLDAWEVPEPPEGLVERTLEAVGRAAAPAAATPVRARSSLAWGLGTSKSLARGLGTSAAARPGWGWKTGIRAAAAAAAVFACALQLSGDFVPRMQERIHEAQIEICAQHLSRLGVALHAYRRDHGEVPARLEDLMAALLKGGYVEDAGLFQCPAHAGGGGYMDFAGMGLGTGAKARALDYPILGDRPGNHEGQMQVLYLSGEVETIDLDALHVSMVGWAHSRSRGGS